MTPASSAEEVVVWLWEGGEIRLRLMGHLSQQLPDVALITSARALVLRDALILVQRDLGSTHIDPGGRLEPGETPEEAVRREVLEERGWTLGPLTLLGYKHFTYLTPQPADLAGLPYPDFLQVVYTAAAGEFRPEAKLDDGYELETSFRTVDEVRMLGLPASQLLFLDAALAGGPATRAANPLLPQRERAG